MLLSTCKITSAARTKTCMARTPDQAGLFETWVPICDVTQLVQDSPDFSYGGVDEFLFLYIRHNFLLFQLVTGCNIILAEKERIWPNQEHVG